MILNALVTACSRVLAQCALSGTGLTVPTSIQILLLITLAEHVRAAVRANYHCVQSLGSEGYSLGHGGLKLQSVGKVILVHVCNYGVGVVDSSEPGLVRGHDHLKQSASRPSLDLRQDVVLGI